MKYSCVILILATSFSCSNSQLNNSPMFVLLDKDSLEVGKISCELPIGFDTAYTWIATSDCMCCDAVMYRAHSKTFNVVKESGFIPIERREKGFYFTISHSTRIRCDTQNINRNSDSKTLMEIRKRNIKGFVSTLRMKSSSIVDELIIDTSHIINNIYYDIFFYSDFHYIRDSENDTIINKVSYDILSAKTEHKNRPIGFSFWNNVYDRDSFYLVAMEMLRSINIK